MQIDTEGVLNVLEHSYPFLLIDKIIDFEYGKFVTACKNISVNEPWAQGHFVGRPIYPGAYIIESSAQAGAFLFYDINEKEHAVSGMLANVEKFKFVQMVKPGDQLIIKITFISKFNNFVRVNVKATVDEKRVAEGVLTYAFG